MSYRNIVESQVELAFILLGDLVTEVTFVDTTVTGYDWSTSSLVQPSSETERSISAVMLKSESKGDPEGSSDVLDLLFWNTELNSTPDINDKLLVGGRGLREYTVIGIPEANEYVTTITVSRPLK
jgi:hypothetical protein